MNCFLPVRPAVKLGVDGPAVGPASELSAVSATYETYKERCQEELNIVPPGAIRLSMTDALRLTNQAGNWLSVSINRSLHPVDPKGFVPRSAVSVELIHLLPMALSLLPADRTGPRTRPRQSDLSRRVCVGRVMELGALFPRHPKSDAAHPQARREDLAPANRVIIREPIPTPNCHRRWNAGPNTDTLGAPSSKPTTEVLR